MTVIRIRAATGASHLRCEWALLDSDGEIIRGEGAVEDIPRHAGQLQLVLPAADVLITRIDVPAAVVRRGGAALAYALEEHAVKEPECLAVSCLMSEGDSHVVAVYDPDIARQWVDALSGLGFQSPEVLCETLLLPRSGDEWSLAWNGSEGYARTAPFEGTATDCGDADVPPLTLVLMLNAAAAQSRLPDAIAVYPAGAECLPDLAAWQHRLGVPLRIAADSWHWSSAPFEDVAPLLTARARWRLSKESVSRLKPAAYILGAALAFHTAALAGDWLMLARECRLIQQHMAERFRSVFPDTVAVVDPALQMRRKLSEARHRVGLPDDGDFLPMIDTVAAALGDLPPGTLRLSSYESGRLTVELAQVDEKRLRQIIARVQQAGLGVSTAAPSGHGVVLTVRSS